MSNAPLTRKDLMRFKAGLLQDLHMLLSNNSPPRRWLKSYEVCYNCTLSFTRLGNILYYDADEIDRLLESRRQHRTGHH